MRPVLFRWNKITVWSYPAMLYLGLVCGVAAGNIAAHRGGLEPFSTYVATMLLIPPALAGARLLFVAGHWREYKGDFRRIWNRHEGGGIMYGGLVAALISSIPLLRLLRINFGSFWDVSVFTILVGMVFTRVGCLLNGCCYGHATEGWLSIRVRNANGVRQRRFPSQILEACCGLVLLVGAFVTWRWMPFPGALFLFVTIGYSSARFFLEFGREHASGQVFQMAYAISAFAVVSSFCTLIFFWR
jgi:phosphatidylglycerol:prolipoprotein diacylglycerol transferase